MTAATPSSIRALARPGRAAAAPAAGDRAALLLLALLIVYAGWIGSAREVDFDFWYHMAEGRALLATHHFSFADTFSHTALGRAYPPTEWLFQVGIFALYSMLGGAGIVLYKTIAVGAWAAVMLAAGRARGAGAASAVAVGALAVLAAMNRFMARPEWITFVGFAWVAAHIDAEERGRAGRGRRAILLAVILVWANAHPGVFFGVALLGLWAIARIIGGRRAGPAAALATAAARDAAGAHAATPRAAILLALAAAALTLATPAGLGNVGFFVHHADVYRRLSVEEFQKLPLVAPLAFIWVYLVFAAILFILRFRDLSGFHRIAIPLFLALAIRNSRLVPLFVGLSAPLLPQWLERSVPALAARRALARGVAIAAVAACVGYRIVETPRWGPIALEIDATQYPKGAADFLEANGVGANGVRAPLYNFHGYGSYLLWRGFRVSTDARLPLYADVFQQFRQKPFESIGRYGISAVVVPSPESVNFELDPIANGFLKRRAGWSLVYRDDVAVVFLKRGAGFDAVIAAHEAAGP